MLTEIYCEQFSDDDGRSRRIRFNPGLNIIRGSQNAANSIGKSTLLLIIDYAFGGDDFIKSEAVEPFAVGHHTIYFAFRFQNTLYHFSRDTSRPGFVQTYTDSDYQHAGEELTLKDFREFLKSNYELTDPDLSWRGAFGIFSRITKDRAINYLKPLKAVAESADRDGIKALEKLFDVYQPLKALEERHAVAQEQLNTLKAAARLGLSDYIKLRTDKEYKTAQRELATAQENLAQLRSQTDQRLFDEDMAKADERSQLNAQLSQLVTYRKDVSAKLAVLERTRRGTPEIDTEEINQLGVFFPDANIAALRQIEGFHRKLTGILDRQLDEQQARYSEIAEVLDGQINQVRTQMAAISISSNLNDRELADAGRYNATIQRLTAQIDAFEKTQAAKTEVKEAAEELASRRPALLGEMTGKLNQALADGNKTIYGDSQNPPEFKLKEGTQGNQTYQFGTPRDKGDGTKAKNLILFDLSVLQLTNLPAVIHDSTIIKNIGDEPVEKIMQLYVESERFGKQVFVAFDKHLSYTAATQATVESHTVIELGEGTASLYGWAWNTKDERGE